jgi:DNA-binding beta-propeller fold protein YncE
LLVGAISNQSFGATGHSYVLEWGGFGFVNEGKFFKPQSLATDDEQNIYVTDSGNAKVQKFTSDGKFLLSWGTNGEEDGQFLFPTGITTFENFVYVLDEKQSTVIPFAILNCPGL